MTPPDDRSGPAPPAGIPLAPTACPPILTSDGTDLIDLLVRSVRDYAIFALDTGGHIVSWNAGARAIKGWTADEVIGRHFSIFYPPEEVAAGKPAWELEVAIRDGRFEEEGWRVCSDGSRFWASVIITALWTSDGTHVGFAKVTRDLTERRAAEQRALDDARRVAEAEAANKAKGEFLAAMSHELRTPLNAIGGYAELIMMGVAGPITDQQREYLARIRHSQRHLLGIITDLLEYSRVEGGQATYQYGVVPMHEVVATVLPMVEPQATAKQLALRLQLCNEALEGWADRTRVEQIVLNLLSNAVKFTPAGGHITVMCSETQERALIVVQDTGPGVPVEKREEIFEPFVQLGRTLTSLQEGTGLGLAISREMARAMGGDLTLEPMTEPGARFVLALPRP